ncbi:hypothetical protein yinte0001_14310 [Yersinia intermedia ATCC 29909]|nr:hypothetical protein yinte0001_14310 [Yersinia intermedia ATCC 29909]
MKVKHIRQLVVHWVNILQQCIIPYFATLRDTSGKRLSGINLWLMNHW